VQIKPWLWVVTVLLSMGAGAVRPAQAVKIVTVNPGTLVSGGSARLTGDGLVYTWQANPSQAFPPSRMLRIGSHYLRIASSRISSDGRELLLELAPEGPFKRLGPDNRFVPDPSAAADLQGPLGLLSLAAGPESEPDVNTNFPVRWHREGDANRTPANP
jgi:hypothetical protein